MTEDQIKALLSSKLNSSIWNSLKSSFLGKELLSYGTAVISMEDSLYYQFLKNLTPSTADTNGLYVLSNLHEVGFEFFRPGYVKVLVPEGVYRPYQIKATLGNVSFTNITYSEGGVVYLYQGKVTVFQDADLSSFNYDIAFNINTFTKILDESTSIQYQKLSKTVLTESVKAFCLVDSVLIPMTEVTEFNKGADVIGYKLMFGYDGFLNFYFGDGAWAQDKINGSEYQILFLDCTFEAFDAESLVYENAGQPLTVTLQDYRQGESNSTYAAITALKAKLAKRSLIASRDQIKSVVNNFPDIIDCNPVKSTVQNQIDVYLKVNDENIYFDDIKDVLTMYGELVTTYNVVSGIQVFFDCLLSASNITLDQKNAISNYIYDAYSLLNLPYKTGISSRSISEDISNMFRVSVQTSLLLEEVGNGSLIRLGMRILKGSISILDGDRNEKGWDTEGMIYGMFQDDVVNLTNLIIKINDFVLCTKDANLCTYNKSFTVKTYNEGAFPILGAFYSAISGPSFVVISDSWVKVFNLDNTYIEGDISIQRNPASAIYPIKVINSTFDPTLAVYMNGIGFYRIDFEDPDYYLNRYEINNDLAKTPNYSVYIGMVPIMAVARFGAYLVGISEDKVFCIKDFYTVPIAAEELIVTGITELQQDLDQVTDIILNEFYFILAKREVVQSTIVLKVFVAGTPMITDNVTKRLSLGTDFIQVYEKVYDPTSEVKLLGVSDNKLLIYSEEFENIVAVDITQESFTVLAEELDDVNSYVRAGTVSYQEKAISLNGYSLSDNPIVYQTTDIFDLLSDDKYPVLDEVIWE